MFVTNYKNVCYKCLLQTNVTISVEVSATFRVNITISIEIFATFRVNVTIFI